MSFNYNNRFDIVPGFLFQLVARPPTFLLLKLLFNLKVKGKEHLKEHRFGKGVIFAANHIQELDGFLLPAAIPIHVFPKPFHPVTREASFYSDKGWRSKLYSQEWFFYSMGAFPAIAGLNNYSKSLHNQIKLIQDNEAVLIFPEGKATKDRTKPKGGVGFLSIYTQTPIVPIYYQPPNKSTFFSRDNSAQVIIGAPVDPPPLSEIHDDLIDHSRKLSEQIMHTIYELRK